MAYSIIRTFPRDTLMTATVYHIPTASGGNAYPMSADETILGARTNISTYQRALLGNDLSFQYLFYVEDNADIREHDKITFSEWSPASGSNVTVEYRCAQVTTIKYGGRPHRAAILTKP